MSRYVPFTSTRIFSIFPSGMLKPVHAKGLIVYESLLDAMKVWYPKSGGKIWRGLLKESPLNRQLLLPGTEPGGSISLWTPGRNIYNWVLVNEDDLLVAHVEARLDGSKPRTRRKNEFG